MQSWEVFAMKCNSAWACCHSKVNIMEKVSYPSPVSYILLLYVTECQWAHDAGLCGAGPYSHPACSDILHPWVNLSCLFSSLSAVGQFVTLSEMCFHRGTPSIPDGFWPAMSPSWNHLELGVALTSVPKGCTPPPPCLPCKPNTVCVSQYYKDDRSTSRDVRGMTHA